MREENIRALLMRREYPALKVVLNSMNNVDLALLLENFKEKEYTILFRLIQKEKAAEVFTEMSSPMQETLINAFTRSEIKELFDDMYMDDTVDIIEEMPANVVEQILDVTDKETRQTINRLLNYPEDSAGSIMTVEYIDLKKDMTVEQALKKIKRVGIDQETIYTCYVIEQKKLIGIVTAKSLLLNESQMLIKDIMETNLIYVNTHEDKENVSKLFQKYGLLAIPVVDCEHCMVGIVTFDDAMEVWQDEVEEDMSIMAAMQPNEDSYFGTSVISHARHRILWLLVLMLSATITGTIITKYEDAFQTLPLLVSFIPMLMDTGGNCGSQSSTLIIRGIAVDEIRFHDFFKVVFKEFRVAILVGFVLAVVNGLRIVIMYHSLRMALLIGLSLMATIILAKIVGCCLPLLAKKIGLDPAIMAAPLITTLVDTCSILIYFNIATHLFSL
ncbi:magnesium transporter [Anaerostipes sp.]|uniref:magnesium transporter n=1 Tax=Anaerostipes sp. TaxID=1872530 RepID=UPI0025C430F6|nr:magnesium transporter [Anaerostipes sp.]MBS7009895.1 magnesium transporter [Anaerostipes sp.]